MSKSILITGGCGFIGSHFVDLAVKNYSEYEILVVEAGGRIQGELGISKQNKLLTKKNGKDKINPKNVALSSKPK